MLKIEEVLVDEHILKIDFACDLTKCKGACCTFPGELGAPVLDSEIEKIKESFSAALEYLSDKSKKYIEDHGFIEGFPGSYATVCIDAKDCVFVYYDENEIAFCALERAYLDGKNKFQKPISCHLFPIREGEFGGESLYYEKIRECKPALHIGREKQIKIFENVKDALVRRFGEDWYQKLLNEKSKI
jgi:hypothetical protein